MAWAKNIQASVRRLNQVEATLAGEFVAREEAVMLMKLAAVCREHLLLIGPPGTAKTSMITRFTQLLSAKGFHYLLTRFTEPSELFGPVDINKFREGVFHVHTQNMLPEAEIAFLDEVFQGSSAILNTLLTLINERIFHNGPNRQATPLVCLIGATNALPEDAALQAMSDRFTLRVALQPVQDHQLDNLLEKGWALEQNAEGQPAQIRMENLVELHQQLTSVRVSDIQPLYSELIRGLRAQGVEISDRRIVKGLKLVAGHALLREAEVASAEDLLPVKYIWSRLEDAQTVAQVVEKHIGQAGGVSYAQVRPIEDIQSDLVVLEARGQGVHGMVAFNAHLAALNRLRREVLRDHREESETLRKIDTTIHGIMLKLAGESHV